MVRTLLYVALLVVLVGCGQPSAARQQQIFATISADIAKDTRVTYRVIGSSKQASVTYVTNSGAIEQQTVTLPWTYEFNGVTSRQFVSLSAQEQSGAADATIRCEITQDGRVIQKATSSGAFHIASCSTSLP